VPCAARAAVGISNASYVPLPPVNSIARLHIAFTVHGRVTADPPAPYSSAAVFEFFGGFPQSIQVVKYAIAAVLRNLRNSKSTGILPFYIL
jgi:hypothetical protein